MSSGKKNETVGFYATFLALWIAQDDKMIINSINTKKK